jgi:hypothetical protein
MEIRMHLAGFEKGFYEMREKEIRYMIDALEARSPSGGASSQIEGNSQL